MIQVVEKIWERIPIHTGDPDNPEAISLLLQHPP
jgi:hypothetical protein